jgi:plasmid maintenance system antidote protein VapI
LNIYRYSGIVESGGVKVLLKDYLAERNMSIYGLAKECGVPYSTLNDFVNGKVRASVCKAGMIRDVAQALGLTMDELYDMSEKADADADDVRVVTSYGLPVDVSVRHKSYYGEFMYNGEPVLIELCKVSGPTRFYIRDIAKWRAEEYIRERRMAEWNTSL